MSKTRDTGYLNNIIKYTESGDITFVNGNTTLLSISSSGAITTTGVISGSSAESAISASYAQAATSASQAQNAISSSFAANAVNSTSASFASNAATATSASQAQSSNTAISSSFATNANLLDGKDSTEFALTGSNIFTGTQYTTDTLNPNGFGASASMYTDGGLRVTKDAYVSGTMYVNNLSVFGTQSINYITSSQLNISTNIISVNTDTPFIRFGGLSVYDSGSTGLTGSILWDSERDHWVYSNPSGSSYNSGMLISGPRNSGSLGTEQGTLNNVIVKGQGGDHVTSSQMIDDGTTVRIPGNLQVTGSVVLSSALTGTSATLNGTLQVTTTSNNGITVTTNDIVTLRMNTSAGTTKNWGFATTNLAASDFGIYQSNSNGGDAISAGTARLYFDGLGNVSIGNTSPAAKLDVNGNGKFTSSTFPLDIYGTTNNYGLRINNTGAPTLLLYSSNANANNRNWGLYTNSEVYGDFDIRQSNAKDGDMTVGGNGTSRFYIKNDGNVGIGTSSPNDKFVVDGGNNIWAGVFRGTSTSSQSFGIQVFGGSNSSDTAFRILNGATTSTYMIVRGDGNVGIGTSSPTEKLQVVGSLQWGSATNYINTSNDGTGIYMEVVGTSNLTRRVRLQGINDAGNRYTAIKVNAGSEVIAFETADIERMRINANGPVDVGGWGTETDISLRIKGNSNGQVGFFNHNGQMYFPFLDTSTGTDLVLTSGGFINKKSSSIRYKKNVEPIDIGLDFILSLNPISYNLKNGDIAQVGFIAEDFPDDRLVSLSMIDTEDVTKGYQKESVNYAQIVAPLVKAIQELTQKVNALENK
jgi:hypothetical protein